MLRLLVICSTFVLTVHSRWCYNDSLIEVECLPIEGWCYKFTNATATYRGCTDINGICSKEDRGCYPQKVTGKDQSWCCCDSDNCNSARNVFSFVTFIIFLILASKRA